MSMAGVTLVIPTDNGARRVEDPPRALLASKDGTARELQDPYAHLR
jgi:hypothetical protein